MNPKTDILLSRYFNGEATNNELRELEIWLAESGKNEKHFEKMTLLYQYLSLSAMPEPDTQNALSEFKTYMQRNAKPSNRIRFVSVYRAMAIAASVLFIVGLFTLIKFSTNSAEKNIQFVATNAAQKYTLFDNATALLEPNSKIIQKSKNEFELVGKATFTVNSKNENEKILVCAGETFIKDIGTEFTVTAYSPAETVTVEVQEGEVQFYTANDSGIRIVKNETANYNPQTKLFQLMQAFSSELLFNATALRDVVFDLETAYGVNIQVHPAELNDIQISAIFDKSEPVDNVLSVIAATLSAKISKNGNAYIISY